MAIFSVFSSVLHLLVLSYRSYLIFLFLSFLSYLSHLIYLILSFLSYLSYFIFLILSFLSYLSYLILVERKWRSWVDSDFVHRISPNIYGTFGESLDAFRYFDQVGDWEKIFSWLDRMLVIYAGAFVMRLVAANLKKKHGLDDDVRGELNASINRFVKSALKGGSQPFAGGENISMADLALYGAMTSFQGCVAFQDMMAANKIIKKWFDDVKKAVDGHEGQALVKEMAEKEGS